MLTNEVVTVATITTVKLAQCNDATFEAVCRDVATIHKKATALVGYVFIDARRRYKDNQSFGAWRTRHFPDINDKDGGRYIRAAGEFNGTGIGTLPTQTQFDLLSAAKVVKEAVTQAIKEGIKVTQEVVRDLKRAAPQQRGAGTRTTANLRHSAVNEPAAQPTGPRSSGGESCVTCSVLYNLPRAPVAYHGARCRPPAVVGAPTRRPAQPQATLTPPQP